MPFAAMVSDLSGRAAALFLPRIFTEFGSDFHNIVLICALFVKICVALICCAAVMWIALGL